MDILGVLQSEHRLIQRMIAVVEVVVREIQAEEEVDISFLRSAADFFQRFADEVHHGKEEDIFFFELLRKRLTPEERSLIEELLEEHHHRKDIVDQVIEAVHRNELSQDSLDFSGAILFHITALSRIYPEHIAREELELYPIARKYFSRHDWRLLDDKFRRFDAEARARHYEELLKNYEEKVATEMAGPVGTTA